MTLPIVGLGPARAEDLTRRAWAAIERAPVVYLRTKEHPLSRRQQIIRAVEELSSSETHRARLITWYATKRCAGDRHKADTLFEKDIHRLLELNRIDEYLDRLDDEIRRANRRALAYLDYRLRSLRPPCLGQAPAQIADRGQSGFTDITACAGGQGAELRFPLRRGSPAPR